MKKINFILYTMKKLSIYLFLIVILVSCHRQAADEDNGIKVVVSILPQKYFVEKIAGTHIGETEVMIPPGSSPATYDPTPRQMTMISNADVYFRIGHIGFEKAWMNRFRESAPDLRIVDLSSGIDLIGADHHHYGEEEHGVDPHIWVSPRNAMFIAQNIYRTMAEIDPENQMDYIKNYNLLIRELKSLDSTINVSLESYENRDFLIYHPALTYYARDYDLKQISVENEGKAPSVNHMAKILNYAGDEGMQYVFVQREFDQEHARKIANEIDAQLITIDPLNENWHEGIMQITEGMKKALGDQNVR